MLANLPEKIKKRLDALKKHPLLYVLAFIIWPILWYFQPAINEFAFKQFTNIFDGESLEKHKSYSSSDGMDKHNGSVMDLDGDENYLVSGSEDDLLKVWHTKNGTLKYTLHYHTGDVRAVELHNGRKIISGGDDGIVYIADIEDDKLYRLIGHNSAIYALFVTGGKIYSSSYDGEIIIWDLINLKEIKRAPISDVAINSLTVANGYLFAASKDKSIYLLDKNSLAIKDTLLAHRKSVQSIKRFELDKLVSSGKDEHLILWDTNSREEMMRIDLGFRISSNELYVYDGRLFVSSHQSEEILIFDLDKGKKLLSQKPTKVLYGPHDHDSIFVGKNCLYAGTDDGTISVWNIQGKITPFGEIYGINLSTKLSACSSPSP